MKTKTTLLLVIANISLLVSQNNIGNSLKPTASDCSKAIPISIKDNMIYGPTVAPMGFGDVQEVTTKNKVQFEKEHNTAWYLLTVQHDGELVIEIVPQDRTNDYDFLIYKYTSTNFCDEFSKNSTLPLRSNLSRVDKSIQGITGLMANVKNSSVGMGIGNAYSKSIPVKTGEQYILVLDNVYANGKGHTIYFNFLKQIEIKGKVVDSDNAAVMADMSLSDNFGNTIEQFKSDKNGDYSLKTAIKETKPLWTESP